MKPPMLSIQRIAPADAVPALRPAMRRSPWGDLVSIDEVIAGAECFQLVDEAGVPRMTYGLEIIRHAGGIEALIVAAAGRYPGVDLTDTTLRVIEAQASRCDVVTAVTKRPALVAKMHLRGYKTVAVILAKAPHANA